MKAIIAVAALLLAVPASAAKWAVDPTASRIGFAATWLGKPLSGSFKHWTAAINFDPAAPQAAVVKVEIDLASAATGDRTADGALPEKDWFDVKTRPIAQFEATSITRTDKSGDTWLAKGTLTIRGRSIAVDLPFKLTIAGDVATMQGSARLDRRSWAIGSESDVAAEFIAFAVPVQITVKARRVK